ncbi:protein ALWAYS EARLY 2-like isoform X1 [Cucurbita moschata]|uniref:Protein ALWAYS EARLY 2-like isoform X1 n=2 Tax=Cucurbita moschata TaxID=3662 RepID=A0A6J1FB98_CUCMO|nr:protein ALWAYS EARLY 2-like isoform X1 [Cucurbita moschata]XP_022937462.1 protein ALWAYS EARLY 2-like isoform X1 [Cucurbita moschata]
MAPPKKSTSRNKRILHSNNPSAEKSYTSSQRSKKRKKNLCEKLGPRWSTREIEIFYEAYRKYGQDWKKVASSTYGRSIEMVEALYNMNRAYLSLPEGTASVVGLIAPMTDYYNVMEGRDSERDNYHASGFQESPKTNQGKVQMSFSNEDYCTSHSVAANGGCLSLLRSLYNGSQPRVVQKRTPRVPISYSNKRNEWKNHASGNESSKKSEFHVSSDEVAHGATLALAEASQRGGTSTTSMPCKIKENLKSSYEVSGGRKGRPIEQFSYDPSLMVDIESARTVKAHHKMKKRYRKEKVLDDKDRQFHQSVDYLTENRPEAPIMDGVGSLSVPEGKVDSEISNADCELSFPLVQKKKSRKQSRGDGNIAVDALQTLADLSSVMPITAMEPEASVQIVEETDSFNLENKSCIEDKAKQVMVPETLNIEDTGYGKSKPGSGLSIVIPDTKIPVDAHLPENLKTATSGHIKPMNNENQVTLPIKQGSRSRCKMGLRRLLTHQKTKPCDDKLEKELMKYSPSVQDRAFFLKDKLSNCMSSTLVRRWCTFEWFYSAIDYPWFARREFVEYLNHVGLKNIPRLTRLEWSVIRSSLGKPRRLSEFFLHGERMKLKLFRESTRKIYADLRAGSREGLPTDLARPLTVGQRVIALLPNTLKVLDGMVLTVNHDKYRIQFDNQEIGVELVMDFDCMPFNPRDNLPVALRCQSRSTNKPPLACKEPKANSHPNLSRELEKASSPYTIDTLVPCTTFNLAQHNTFPGNSLPLWSMAPSLANTRAPSSIPHSLNVSHELGCGVVDIVRGSREKAQLMVNVAIEVMLSTSQGDDPLTIICGALHSFESFEYQKPLSKSQEYINDSLGPFNQLCSLEHLSTSDLISPRSRRSDKDYGGIPSNLITSCVATLLMIQACVEYPYPPGDVAQILGLAVKSLHPRCSQNLHFYKEIETCIGRICSNLNSI